MELLKEALEESLINVCWSGGFGILNKKEVTRWGEGERAMVEYPREFVGERGI